MSEETGGEAPPFALQRLGVVMEPRPGDPAEAWGVLNPAAARGPDGALYLFPRLVAEGNYSRIGIVPNVVFPTGLDPSARGAVDVYYGMADARIGAARVALPSTLPPPPPPRRRPGLPSSGSPSPLPEAPWSAAWYGAAQERRG